MKLHLSTWVEVETYLKRSKAILLPIGSTEQHGPNGFLGTDALCPDIIADAAAADREDILIGPCFNVGCAQHHLGFPGTITLRPSTMIAAMKDWTDSLTRNGFERFYWLNGHGGNVATIQAAFAEIYADRSFHDADPARPLIQKSVNWWELSGVFDFCAKMYPSGHGSHATASEVSVTYAAYPDHVKRIEMSPKIAPNGPIRDASDYRARFPDGRIGSDPSQSTPEDGQKIIDKAAEQLVTDFLKFSEV